MTGYSSPLPSSDLLEAICADGQDHRAPMPRNRRVYWQSEGSEEDVPHKVRFRATGFPGTNYSVCWDPLQTLRVHVYECNHVLQAVRASLRATPSVSAECSYFDPIPDRWESLDVQVRFVKKRFILRSVRYASFDAFFSRLPNLEIASVS